VALATIVHGGLLLLLDLLLDRFELLPGRTAQVADAMIYGLIFITFLRGLTRAVLAPGRPDWRMVELSDERASAFAGSIVTIASVEIGLQEFDATALHGARMTRENVEEVFRTLATETLADRKFNPGLPADRADVIVGGCCVLVGVMRKLRVSEIMVSVNNLLDGLVRDELKLS
jgi:hypothetical protein